MADSGKEGQVEFGTNAMGFATGDEPMPTPDNNQPAPPEPQVVNPPAEDPAPNPTPEPTPVDTPAPVVEPNNDTPPVDTPPANEPEPTPENNGDAPAESTPTPEPEPTPETEPQAELNDEAFLQWYQKKTGTEIKSLEDLKKPEPVDPLAGLPESTQQYLKFNQETGRSYEDFQKLNVDYSKMTPLESAQQRAIQLSDGTLHSGNVNGYLEKKLDIDLSDPAALETFDMLSLKEYGAEYVKGQMADQEKYKQPIEVAPKPDGPEMVTLEDGTQWTKEAYDNKVNEINIYRESIKNSTDKITSSDFEIKIDDNGTEKIMNLSYDYSKEDKHDMVSEALDVDNFVKNNFSDKEGNIDHKALQEGLHRANPLKFRKIVSSLVHKALAQQAEEFTKIGMNANFNTPSMPGSNSAQEKPKGLPYLDSVKNYGVPYDISQFK